MSYTSARLDEKSTRVEGLITEHLDLWSSAIKKRSAVGRGSSKKLELYGIKKLRELILELAVRGMLVQQAPNDEPASELLKKIAEHKEQLVKEKKIRKPRPLEAISTDEEFMPLPQGWEFVRLNDLGDWGAGATPSRSSPDLYGGTIPWFKSGELNADYISVSEETVTEKALEKASLRYNQAGDVLIAMYGATIGKTSILSVPATTNQAVCACTPFEGLANTYLLTILKAYRSRFVGMGSGGAQPNISREKIIATVVALPPLNEQHRIVATVDELMALCDQLEQQAETSLTAHQTLVETLLNALTATDQGSINKSASQQRFQQAWKRIEEHFDLLFTNEHSIEQLKQTILQLGVSGKLVPQDSEDEPASKLLIKIAAEKSRLVKERKISKTKPLPPIPEETKSSALPEGWNFVRLGEIINLVSGQHLKPDEYSDTKTQGSVPYITGPAEFGTEFPSYSKFTTKKRALADDGDILITCKGSGIGKLNSSNGTIAISRQLMAIRPILISDKFVKLFISSKYNYFQSKGIGIAIPGISREDILDLVFTIPPEKEQHRIVAKVDQLMALCDKLTACLSHAQTTQLQLADAITERTLAS